MKIVTPLLSIFVGFTGPIVFIAAIGGTGPAAMQLIQIITTLECALMIVVGTWTLAKEAIEI